MRRLVGTMTCECGVEFDLWDDDDREAWERRLEEHLATHRAPKEGTGARRLD